MARKKSEDKPKKHRVRPLLVLGAAAGGLAYAMSKRERPAPPVASGSPEERLMVKDEENLSGLGAIMKGLMSEFVKDPGKVRILNTLNLSVAIEPVEQPEAAITMKFSNGCIIIEPGAASSDIKIVCELQVLLQMAQMPAGLAAVKYMATPEGKELISKFISGDLKLKGLATHPMGMLKFSQFLAPTRG
jgi:hypothetical protein